MNFIEDAQIIIPALTKISITVYDNDEHTLEEFENKFSFLPDIQPLYTQKGFLTFFEKRKDSEVYTVADALNTHSIILRLNDRWVIIGPYVLDNWNENVAKKLLKKYQMVDKIQKFKAYQYSLPIIKQKYAEDIAELLLSNTVGSHIDNPVHIDMTSQKAEELGKQTPEVYEDFELVNRRYTFETQIKDLVKHGDAVRLFKLLEDNQDLEVGIKFLSDSTSDKIAAAFAIRVLVRQASIEAGLTPVFVDALSQEYAQKMHKATNEEQLKNLMRQYIMAFCYAVKENQRSDYSIYVKRVLQYIELQLNQQITLEELCKLNNITQSYLSKLFHKETGKTVKQYIMQSRCQRAADLLENSNMSIQEISHYVGYDDTNYFSRIFKKIMNTTPQEYRKSKMCY
jgi:YesN/AraC family two-component response regulator